MNRTKIPCFLDTLSVFLWRTLAISALFQWVVGSLFSPLCIYLQGLETPMKQSETQAAVNSSKKLKSTRNSTETKDDSAATCFNPYIRQTFTERN